MSPEDAPISLDARRERARSDAPMRCRRCGGEWHVLTPVTDDVPAAVTLSNDRRITGYTGFPVCLECGK